ncbi:unnamed protein product, partial [marine sediment metagenome]
MTRKQSEASKRRWQDSEYRKKTIDAMKGRTAWNKGKKRSPETCQ